MFILNMQYRIKQLIMQSKILNPYCHYNSIIHEGERVRTMHRTEYSMEKLLVKAGVKQEHIQQYLNQRSKAKDKRDSSRSMPKVQPKLGRSPQGSAGQYFVKTKSQRAFKTSSINTNKEINNQESKLRESSKGSGSKHNSNYFIQKSKHRGSELSLNKKSNKAQIKLNEAENKQKIAKQSIMSNSSKKNQIINEYGLQMSKSSSKINENSVRSIQSKLKSNLSLNNESFSSSKTSQKKRQSNPISNFERTEPDPSENSKQNFSILKIGEIKNQIIKGSSPKRESWKDTIKSLEGLSQSKHSNKQSDSSSSSVEFEKPTLAKKDELRINSVHNQNPINIGAQSMQKNSWKHLPLASKQPSQRKSYQSYVDKPEPGSLRHVMENIEIHEYLVTLVSDFKDQVDNFQVGDVQKNVLLFLLDKKHFLQKSNMCKALKGGKNIFNISSLEISNESLNLFMNNPDVLKFIKQLEVSNRQLFKKLQKSYLQIKPKTNNNTYIKLQTPFDDFSKQIVRILNMEFELEFPKLEKQKNSDELETLQNKIFDIMQMIFLLSELNGRQVKKIQFFDEIANFSQYYEQNKQVYFNTINYFKSTK